MDFYALEADVPLTKTIHRDHVDPYPHVLNFTSHKFSVKGIQAFATKLEEHADAGHCLVKGVLQRPLINEPRRGATDPQDPTQWVCLDFDGLEVTDLEATLQELGCDADHVVQYSASSGFKSGIRAHVFYFLSSPVVPSLLKLWLKHLNLTYLRDHITLNRAGTTLRWPIDVSACQNDKLLYIAPPKLVNVAPAHRGLRVKLVKGRARTLTLPLDGLRAEALRAQELAALNDLRRAAGLPQRKKERFAEVGNVEVLKNPGTAVVTGEREGRGFVYLNLNGGDSWAYYYPQDNPTVLYNFKGEPNYLLKELCPDYRPLVSQVRNDIQPGAVHYLAVVGKQDDRYYVGIYDEAAQTLDMRPTSSMEKVKHFLKEHGQYIPDFIPVWDIGYDFQSDVLVDFEKKTINLYQMSPYMRNARKAAKPPGFIHSIVMHVFGNDLEVVEHFYNWFAVVCQKRTKTMTAWVLSGTEGTGKGLLFHRVLTPLLGSTYCRMVQLRTFEKEFNLFMESSLIVMINESEISAVDRHRAQVMAAIKELITDPVISIRRMYADSYKTLNAANFIIASNKFDSIEIAAGDRRFNVAPRQEEKLPYPKDSIEQQIAAELQDFANYIMYRPAQESLAASIIETDERTDLHSLSVTGPDQVAEAIRKGDIDFFWHERPDKEDPVMLEVSTDYTMPTYAEVLDFMFENRGQRTNLPRNWLAPLFYYVSENKFRSKSKFSKFLGHKGLKITAVGWQDTVVRGIYGITWKCSDEVYADWERTKKVVAIKEKKTPRRLQA
jgi:hypothetical protein